MNTAYSTNTTKTASLALGIVLFLGVTAIPSPSLSQDANPSSENISKQRSTTKRLPEVVGVVSKKLKSILPVGWSLKREKNIVTIRRDKPIEWYGTISLPNHRNLEELKAKGLVQCGTYAITLEFFLPMSKADVDALIETNRQIERRFYEEHPQPKNIKPSVPWELQQSLRHIPNLFTKHYSVLVTPFVHGNRMAFFRKQDKKECEGVEQTIRCLLAANTEALPLVADDKASLQGVWIAESVEIDGKPAPAKRVQRMRFTFKKDELLIRGNFDNDTEITGKYKIDDKHYPKHIDIMPPEEKNSIQGIYAINGDVLIICLRHAGSPGGRPSDFATKPHSKLVLTVFKRAKPK